MLSLSQWYRQKYIFKRVTKFSHRLLTVYNNTIICALKRLSAWGNEEWQGISCRQSLSVHPQTTQVHHVVLPLFQLREPPLSPSIASAMWTTFIALHCFSCVNHLYNPPLFKLHEPPLSPSIFSIHPSKRCWANKNLCLYCGLQTAN